MFVYDAREFSTQWAYVAGDASLVPRLLILMPRSRTVLTAPSEMIEELSRLPAVTELFVQKPMAVDRGQERLVDSTPAIHLTPEHPVSYEKLVVPAAVQLIDEVLAHNRRFLGTEVIYGFLADGGTAAEVAGTNARSPRV